MTNLQSVPRRLEGIKQKLEGDRLTLSVAGNVIECPQADGIVWALCDGRSAAVTRRADLNRRCNSGALRVRGMMED